MNTQVEYSKTDLQAGRAGARFPFSASPRGWYAVAWVEDLALASVRPARLCDRDIVVVRTESGEVAVYDAHCPHLGAHLGYGGIVEGEHLRCPFHGWEYDGHGRCSKIPFVDTPMKVGLRQWPTVVRGGMLQAWHDPNDQPALWTPVEIEQDGWTAPIHREDCYWNLRAHVQDIAENGIDVAHFTTVHGAQAVGDLLDLRYEGAHASWTSLSVSDLGGKPSIAKASVVLNALGLHQVQVVIDQDKLQFRSFLYVTPVAEGRIDIRMTVSVKSSGDRRKDRMLLSYLLPRLTGELAKDFAIWENKIYIERPPLSRVDGPIRHFRQWASAFYR
ncbi:Rieske 2Fe-2S domain-containing protein [Pseudomonas promysalinigenes]|uniref:cholesterol 7-desaturase n=1 Tax=Pseudomonas putida TaxID=303 RepID=G8AA84_PSEPU|nr:Rieske 2Fe-2S domain-containing protein [Pseudomonas promysalinigenes]ADQ74614.1 Rieske [2Fe-2S] domain protein [Pseudomonas putida]QXI32365.1 Rieske (2Fe-2S) protein [Pseudomonas promysalinigenes]